MDAIDFLSLDDVLLVHQDQTRRYGGSSELRDRELLESALAQPQASFAGAHLHKFPFEMAAAYLFHIVQNHPFVDGNKRTGVVAALLFLELNGLTVTAPRGTLYELTMSVARGELGKPEIADRLRHHATTS